MNESTSTICPHDLEEESCDTCAHVRERRASSTGEMIEYLKTTLKAVLRISSASSVDKRLRDRLEEIEDEVGIALGTLEQWEADRQTARQAQTPASIKSASIKPASVVVGLALCLALTVQTGCGLIAQYSFGWNANTTRTVPLDGPDQRRLDVDVTIESPSVWALAIGAGAELLAARAIPVSDTDDAGKSTVSPTRLLLVIGLGLASVVDLIAVLVHASDGSTIKRVTLHQDPGVTGPGTTVP